MFDTAAEGCPTRLGGRVREARDRTRASRLLREEMLQTRSKGRKYHTFCSGKKKRKGFKPRQATRARQLPHSPRKLNRATTMHARVLSSSARAPAATRGGGLVKVCFPCLCSKRSFDRSLSSLSLESRFPVCVSRSTSRSRFDSRSRAFYVSKSMLSRRTKNTRRPENLLETRKGIGATSLEFPPEETLLTKRFLFRPRPSRVSSPCLASRALAHQKLNPSSSRHRRLFGDL